VAHDVFISYSNKDKAVADAVCAGLEAARIRCWVAPRDVPPGAEWAASIVDALKSSRVMVLVFSRSSRGSEQVHRELTVAADAGVVIVPLKIDDTALEGLMEYYLANRHWLDTMNPPTEAQVAELVETVGQVVKSRGGGARGFGRLPMSRGLSRRVAWILAVVGLLAVLAVGISVWAALKPSMPDVTSQMPVSGPRLGDAQPIGTLSLPGDVGGACLSDDILYVACGEAGLVVADVSDPAQPEIAAQIAVADAATVDAAEGYLYVAEGEDAAGDASGAGAGSRVHIYDVANPTAPQLVAEYRSESISSGTGGSIQEISAHGPYLALATWQTLELVDVSDPTRPRQLWTWTAAGNTGITCGAAFIDSAALPKSEEDVLALAAGWEGLRFFGLSDPSSPKPLGVYSPQDWVADVVAGDSSIVYAAVGSAGLATLDIADPASPQPSAIYEVAGITSKIRRVGQALYYSYYEPQDGHEFGNGVGRVAIADSEGPMTTVRGTETMRDIGAVSSLEADKEHVYVTVEGLGLFVYTAE